MNIFAKVTAAAALALVAAPALANPDDNNPVYDLLAAPQGSELSRDVNATASTSSVSETVVVSDEAFAVNADRQQDFINEGR